ncbi:unnamed protein product [Soboliphyme baturini]|uniref:Glycogen synthase n=1 Tax=Soboliphyme baturini TaxID=241478 RepID=A0A183IAN1_9BILA|nr:unnamed protein product [Soboliphyme baturini]
MQDYDRVARYDGIGGSETDLRFAAERASPDVTILGPVHSQLPDLTEQGSSDEYLSKIFQPTLAHWLQQHIVFLYLF